MTAQTEVVPLAAPQVEAVGEVLRKAFYDNPGPMYVQPDDAKRALQLTWFMTRATRYGHIYGEVYTTAGKVEGAAIWLPPDDWEITPNRSKQVGLDEPPSIIGAEALDRSSSMANHLELLHKRDVAPRHWYLWLLGVNPSRQGQGIGSALIRPILVRADAEGLPCYLETAEPRNVPFYQRHGFEVVVEGDIPNGGPHFWTMKREPVR